MSAEPAVFQFLSIERPAVTARLIRKLNPHDATLIIDMEDALEDVVNPGRTSGLRIQARQHLIDLAFSERALFDRYRIGARINRLSSPDFPLDVEALATLSQAASLDCIVLTKVQSADDLARCISELDAGRVRYGSLIPIVETKEGIGRLGAIASAARERGMEFLIYGHFDYSLDAGHWPFLEEDEAAFWAHVTPIIGEIERARLCYVHPPISRVDDAVLLADIARQLKALCNRRFGLIAVTGSQTALCKLLDATPMTSASRASLKEAAPRKQDDLIDQAESVRRAVEANRRHDKSFSLDSRAGRFVPVHVYLAAVRFLEGISHGDREG